MSMQRIKNNEFGYLGNPSIKRDGVVGDFTRKEIIEYQKCQEKVVEYKQQYKPHLEDKELLSILFLC